MTVTEIASLALSLISAKGITDFDVDENQQARACRKWFAPARDEALGRHPWNFATKQAGLTLTWTALSGVALSSNSAGEIRVSAADHSLTTGQRIHMRDVQGVAAANGTWKVTVINSSTYDLDDSVFSGSHTSGTGEWILAPRFGWDYQHAKPSDCLRVNAVNSYDQAVEDDSARYEVQGDYILSDKEEIELSYVFQQTDTTKWPQDFINAFAVLMASYMAAELCGQAGKGQELRVQFENLFSPEMKSKDARQGKGRVPPSSYDSPLVRARLGLS